MSVVESHDMPRTSIKGEIADEVVKEWIGKIREGNDFYFEQITVALEWKDPVAVSFLRKVAEVDPLVAFSRFESFLDVLNED